MKIEFPKLNQSQYNTLMQRYGGQNLVPFSENRAKPYILEDFLHPKIQAYNGRWLHTSVMSTAGIPDSWRTFLPDKPLVNAVINDMNCWTTAYDVIRDWHTPFNQMQGIIGFYDGALVTKSLKNTQFFEKIVVLEAEEAWSMPQKWNENRQVGDILYIENPTVRGTPGHMAIWLDNDLYFEKTNGGNTEPIRLSHVSNILGQYTKQVERVSFFRPKSNVKIPSALDFQREIELKAAEPLPPAWKGNLISYANYGMGGGVTSISLSKLISFKMTAEPETGRATFQGADNYLNFVNGEAVCWSTSPSQFQYQISHLKQLSVRNATGKEVASLPGQTKFEDFQSGDKKATSALKFASSDKTLLLYSHMPQSGQVQIFLNHPGVADSIPMECARDLRALFN